MEPGATDPPSEDALARPGEQAVVDEEPSDAHLVAETIAGRRAAFDQLVRRYQRQAVAVSYRLLGNTEDAVEVTQDAFLKAYNGVATLQRPEAFGGWLLRIVSNLSLNFRRGRSHRRSVSLDEAAGVEDGSTADGSWAAKSGDPVRTLQGRELGRSLQAALAMLPEKQRLALVMFTVEQMPQKDVAEVLQCSVEAVKWHVFQGRKKLRELLKDQLQE